MPAVSDWIERWQPLLAASLTFVSACIFAAVSIRMMRSDIWGATRAVRSRGDLRLEPRATEGMAQNNPVDLVQTLEQIRSVVRSALSTLTLSDEGATNFFTTSYASCLRITYLPLEPSALPPNAPQAAYRHLETLKQHISALRLLSKEMPTSQISEILINVHSTARHLARTLRLRVENKPAAVDSTPVKAGRSSAS